jgi:hypothetical protein
MIISMPCVFQTAQNLAKSKDADERSNLYRWAEAFFSLISVTAGSTGYATFSTRCSDMSGLLTKSRKVFAFPTCIGKGESVLNGMNSVKKSFNLGFFSAIDSIRNLAIKTFKFSAAVMSVVEMLAKDAIIDLGKCSTIIMKPVTYLKGHFEGYFSESFWNTFEKVSGISKLFTVAFLSLSLVDDVKVYGYNATRATLKVATTASLISLTLFTKMMPKMAVPALALFAATSLIYQIETRSEEYPFS